MVRKLRKMPHAQACVRDYSDVGRDKVVLQSYYTDVITVTDGKMYCSGLYSMTTRKHISAFLWEYFPQIGFQKVKEIVGNKLYIDLLTGEIGED